MNAGWERPELVKPDGITEEEWQVWLNTRVELMPPGLNRKVRAAMRITERAGKGHVPDENLARYRRIAGIADQFRSLAGAVSGYGEYGDANLCWELEKKYRDKANELRADLPDKPTEETP